jgi:outer membrane usher protein
VFLANRVDDGFAIVKGGGPGVDVLLNSTRVATTNSRGRAFVPNLQPYQNNNVSIDPSNLSLDLQPQETDAIVVPADQSGAVVDFGVSKVEGAVTLPAAAGTCSASFDFEPVEGEQVEIGPLPCT